MMYSRQIAFSLVTLCGIAVIAILRKSRLRNAANKKDIISQQEKDIISQEERDIISQLPDDILISIITRMSTKFAVRTSILSKRWRNLHKFASDIDFRCPIVHHPASYHYNGHEAGIIHRVQRFLRCRSDSKIRSFDFRCRLTKPYANKFVECIYSLGRLGVEELIVHFSCCRNFPSCYNYSCRREFNAISFSCHLLSEMPSLKYLQLAVCSLKPNLTTQCNSLQTLSLIYVKVTPSALECILSNCLMLHSLIIDSCDCPPKLCFRGPNLRLKSLIIKLRGGRKEIELHASNLITIEFYKFEIVKLILDHVPQLQSIHLDTHIKSIMSYVFEELAKDLPHLKSLAFAIRPYFYQESMRLMGMGRIVTFSNLRRLELRLYLHKANLLALTPFLQSCPLLQEFHLDISYNVEYDRGVAQPRKQVTLHSELKKVKISGFRGAKNEMEFALYILKSAVNLEQMHLIVRRSEYYYYYYMRFMRDKDKTRWHRQLQGHAISKVAQVIIQFAF